MPERLVSTIDITQFDHGSSEERRAIAEQVDKACQSIGFLVVTGHGVPRQDVDDALATSRSFFDLPNAEKRLSMSNGELSFLGYKELSTSNLAATLGAERPPDLREIYTVGVGNKFANDFAGFPGVDDLYAPNRWPRRPSDFSATHLRLYQEMEALAERLMRIFAFSLRLPEEYFADKIDRHFSPLGSFHYPAIENSPHPDQIGCGAHTDFGSLTLLAMEKTGEHCVTGSNRSTKRPTGNLQIRTPSGNWENVTANPDEFIVNIGDMMARWTNDRWTSTLHRVTAPPMGSDIARRQSIGYFLHPNYDAEVRCLATCTSPDNPPRYPPVTAGPEMYKKLSMSRVAR